MLKSMFYGLVLSLQFFSRIPVPLQAPWHEQVKVWALRFFPWVGAVIGLFVVLLASVFMPHVPSLFLTLLLLTVWVGLTGGLHLDGWLDVSDALGSQAPLEKKWRIMEEPQVGSFAVLSVFFLLAWKGSLLYLLLTLWETQDVLNQAGFLLIFILIPFISRLGGALLLLFLPVYKEEGLAWEWKRGLQLKDLSWFIIPFLILCVCTAMVHTLWPYILFLTAGMTVYFFVFGSYLNRALGGIGGDVIGASVEGGEVWGLLLSWIYIWFVMV
ncbi:adenosylcobinamide-GDP ribazoletransferase [Caldalkalibacillus salinus]|uniref:adenosylcobinamide-GDP ribazoletransferase n=1 Tax=Caldalkalibacillus salinus TaxID=2803787 RepID=UPI0019216C86|nr:adenosylcobinamide-GDP ribazoletransferase [Caldalkalibacillus salinus]